MTTPIVPSISDEQLAELEEYCEKKAFVCCGNLSVGGEYMGAKEMVCCGEPELTQVDINTPAEEILGLIARLRAAEADARRYQWLTGSNPTMGILERMTRGELIGHEIDMVIDLAMERTP